jgi:hypothetical protein
MSIQERIPLRDHFLQITPGYAQAVLDRLDKILQGAGIVPQPGLRLRLSEVGVVLQPLLSRWLDLEVADEATAALIERANQLGSLKGDLQWATLNLETTTWALRRNQTDRYELSEESHELIMGLYQAGRERLYKAAAGELRDRQLIANLASGIQLAVYSDLYLQSASKGALSDMRLFQPRGHRRVDFDAHYPLILEMLDALVAVQAAPVVALTVAG